MKTTAALFIALFFATNFKAGNSTGEFSKQIKTALVMPESMKQDAALFPDGQKVSIFFVVDENGNVTEANAKTKNTVAKKDLESQFMKMNFRDLQACVAHTVEVNFVVH